MKFDDQQTKVIDHSNGHCLVLAGAGSGKTSTATERTARLIENGLPGRNIVMVTFTNKAAREMRERVHYRTQALNLDINQSPTVTTFHSFGQKIINKNTEACMRQGVPTLMPEDEQTSLLEECLKKINNKYVSTSAIAIFDKIRNIGLSAVFPDDEDLFQRILDKYCQELTIPIKSEPVYQCFRDYENTKIKLNVMDYHDLLILPIMALRQDHILLDRMRKSIIDLTVDEAQDTNIAQYKLIKLVAPPDGNQSVLMIGDEDQSIHRWRGANPDNMKLFAKDYDPLFYRLENNYRSTPMIVTSADKLIHHNSNRFEKKGVPTRANIKGSIDFNAHASINDMSFFIATKIRNLIESGTNPNNIAILYRTNRMANLIEPLLLSNQIPYKVYNGQDLLSRSECKLLLAALRFTINPYDLKAFERLSELMPGVGEKFLSKLFSNIGKGESIFDAAKRLPEPQQRSIFPILESIIKLRTTGPTGIVSWAMSQPVITEWITKKASAKLKADRVDKPKEFGIWQKSNQNENLTKEELSSLNAKVSKACQFYEEKLVDVIDAIVFRMELIGDTIINRCESLPKTATINDQWYEANFIITNPPDEDSKSPSVNLMAIHSSKGLEWDHVFIAGACDGLMPLSSSHINEVDERLHIEDERRLAYVAYTRAKNHLYPLYFKTGNLNDGKGFRDFNPSPFLDEAGFISDNDLDETDYSKIAMNS